MLKSGKGKQNNKTYSNNRHDVVVSKIQNIKNRKLNTPTHFINISYLNSFYCYTFIIINQ